jgi:hypothetical protein
MPADIIPIIKQLSQAENDSTATGGLRPNVVSLIAFTLPFLLGLFTALALSNPAGVIIGALLGFLASLAPRVAKQWERAVVLRLGRYTGLRGPGLFWVVPLID